MQIDPIISVANAPLGTERFAANWITVPVLGLGVSLAAATRPAGAGPWPAVLLLHGTHGFAQEYVRLATDLSRAGLLAVAACWFRGGSGEGTRFISPIVCADAPPRPDPLSDDALLTVSTLVHAVRTLPDARPDALGIFGHSRGGGAALNYVLRKGDVQAAVLNSARYPDELRALASKLEVPLLILHGTADSPADGGTRLRARRWLVILKEGSLPPGKLSRRDSTKVVDITVSLRVRLNIWMQSSELWVSSGANFRKRRRGPLLGHIADLRG